MIFYNIYSSEEEKIFDHRLFLGALLHDTENTILKDFQITSLPATWEADA